MAGSPSVAYKFGVERCSSEPRALFSRKREVALCAVYVKNDYLELIPKVYVPEMYPEVRQVVKTQLRPNDQLWGSLENLDAWELLMLKTYSGDLYNGVQAVRISEISGYEGQLQSAWPIPILKYMFAKCTISEGEEKLHGLRKVNYAEVMSPNEVDESFEVWGNVFGKEHYNNS